MKKIIILFLLILTSIGVYAVHTSVPNVNWENSELNSWKNQNLCSCWSITESIKKYRNKDIDALQVASQCNNVCNHCEQKSTKPVDDCLSTCMSNGALRTEKQLIGCMQACTQNYCSNEFKLEYTPVKKAEVKIEPKKEETAPKEEVKTEPKEEPKPEPKKELPEEVEVVQEVKVEKAPPQKQILTTEQCTQLAAQTKTENFCNEDYALSKFIIDINQKLQENQDSSGCTTAWNEYYKEEKKNCRSQLMNYLIEKRNLLPLLVIVLAAIIIFVAAFYYIHRKRSHPAEWKETILDEEPEGIKIEPLKETTPQKEMPKKEKKKPAESVKNQRKKIPFEKHPEFYLRNNKKKE